MEIITLFTLVLKPSAIYLVYVGTIPFVITVSLLYFHFSYFKKKVPNRFILHSSYLGLLCATIFTSAVMVITSNRDTSGGAWAAILAFPSLLGASFIGFLIITFLELLFFFAHFVSNQYYKRK